LQPSPKAKCPRIGALLTPQNGAIREMNMLDGLIDEARISPAKSARQIFTLANIPSGSSRADIPDPARV